MVEANFFDRIIKDHATKLARNCRINRQVSETDDVFLYLVNLEILQENGDWFSIVSYEITDYQSCKIESSPQGRSKAMRINLPFEKARQMSENDLKLNWRRYADSYLHRES